MAPGDAVLLYSDGLVETRARSIEEGIIGLQEIAEPLVLEGHPAPAGIIAERLRALGQGLDDDLSLFYLRRPVPGEDQSGS